MITGTWWESLLWVIGACIIIPRTIKLYVDSHDPWTLVGMGLWLFILVSQAVVMERNNKLIKK